MSVLAAPPYQGPAKRGENGVEQIQPGLKRCPACGNDRLYFIGEMCGECYAAGKDLVRSAAGGVSGKEGTMAAGKRVECEWCHKQKSNIYEHRKVCKQRPARSAGQASGPAGEPAGQEPKGQRRGRKPRRPKGNGHALPAELGRCLFCDGAPNMALARDLATRMIRGGMTFESARDMAREVLGMVGR